MTVESILMSKKRGSMVSFDRYRIRFRQHFRTGGHSDLASFYLLVFLGNESDGTTTSKVHPAQLQGPMVHV